MRITHRIRVYSARTCCRGILMAAVSFVVAASGDEVTRLDRPPTGGLNAHYVVNRAPLLSTPLIKLPVGAVRPRGWLLRCLELQRDGMCGHLNEISAWLQKDDNAWLSKDGKGKWGWEEVPYWLKGFGDTGYLLDDERMIAEARIWIEAAFASQRPDGNFGPVQQFSDDGSQDFWANMIMLFCLQSYHEYTGDPRVLELMNRYFAFQATVPDEKLLTHYWQHMRGGDNLFSIYWLYNRTGDESLLQLAERIHRNTANWTLPDTLPNWHNVNIAQCFGEPATFYMQSKQPGHLEAAYRNFHIIRDLYGQVPGGMFGGDENSRRGYDDPRQGIETCGIVEQMLSDETLLAISGDPFWADHAEEVAFNTLPAAFTPDFKALRYLTSPNMPLSDAKNHAPGFDNRGPMLAMNALSHRCCQHNHGHGWPYFVEHLWMATADNGVCAAIYGPSEVAVKVGDGAEVRIEEDTRYPFEEEIRFTMRSSSPVEFPLYVRIPAWCKDATISLNGNSLAFESVPGGYVRIRRTWADGDRLTLRLPMQVSIRRWAKNHDSASVDYGPLTFSLRIGEQYSKCDPRTTAYPDSKWREDLDVVAWPAYEMLPTTPWNYGLVLDAAAPAKGIEVRRRDWPADDFPFTVDAVPLAITARAKKIPEWSLDNTGLCAALQKSPVRTDEPEESVTLIPMGAARLRISAFPVCGDGADATKWHAVTAARRLYSATASYCHRADAIEAIADGIVPSSSADVYVPRHTFWPHKGTQEWLAAAFDASRTVSQVSVYWYDDEAIEGGCRVPQSWRILYREGGEWKPVHGAASYGVQKDGFNKVAFDAVRTDGLRLELALRPGYSAGVLEWRIAPE